MESKQTSSPREMWRTFSQGELVLLFAVLLPRPAFTGEWSAVDASCSPAPVNFGSRHHESAAQFSLGYSTYTNFIFPATRPLVRRLVYVTARAEKFLTAKIRFLFAGRSLVNHAVEVS